MTIQPNIPKSQTSNASKLMISLLKKLVDTPIKRNGRKIAIKTANGMVEFALPAKREIRNRDIS